MRDFKLSDLRALNSKDFDLEFDIAKTSKRQVLIDVADSPSFCKPYQLCPVCNNTIDDCDNNNICDNSLFENFDDSEDEIDAEKRSKVDTATILKTNVEIIPKEIWRKSLYERCRAKQYVY